MNPEDIDQPVQLEDGKYTIQKDSKGMLEFLRYGEAWPAADDLKYSQLIIAMFNEIQNQRLAIHTLEAYARSVEKERDLLEAKLEIANRFVDSQV